MAPAEVRTLLAKFGLKADHVTRPVGELSPGERTRAALALLQARGVNLLVLDEPTNHLDLPAIEQLEQALESYDGHAAAGHPRPPDARHGAARPALARRRRPGDRQPRGLTPVRAGRTTGLELGHLAEGCGDPDLRTAEVHRHPTGVDPDDPTQPVGVVRHPVVERELLDHGFGLGLEGAARVTWARVAS